MEPGDDETTQEQKSNNDELTSEPDEEATRRNFTTSNDKPHLPKPNSEEKSQRQDVTQQDEKLPPKTQNKSENNEEKHRNGQSNEETNSADCTVVTNGADCGVQNLGFTNEEMRSDERKETTEMRIISKEKSLGKNQLEHELNKEKRRALKNLLVISVSFLLLFTAYRGLENLQSSLNNEKGLGLASLGVIYGCVIISSMFLPPLVIGRFGLKWTLVGAMACYVTYTVSNYYPRWYTLIPSSAILGLAGAPLWASKCAVVTSTGISYAALTGEHQDVIITKFFGIFFMIYQSCQVIGNLISSLVLKSPEQYGNITSEIVKFCGADDCGNNPTENSNLTETLSARPDETLVFTLVTVFVVSGLLAILNVAIFLDKVKVEGTATKEGTFKTLVATLRHIWNDRMQQLIIPLTIFSGLEQAFIIGEFTKSYVTCALGINWVGFVMISFGVSDSLFSFILGKISKFTGRLPIFISGAIVNLTAMIVMLLWKPSEEYRWIFFILTLMWGYGDAVWNTQNNALYGVLFHKNQEAAFSNYRMWESMGFVLAFVFSRYLCVEVKLYILFAVLAVGICLYLIIEIKLRNIRTRVEVIQEE